MKSEWFAIGTRWWANEDVDATEYPWALPFIIDAIKAGNGRCIEAALSDVRILRSARLDHAIRPNGYAIRDAYVAAGIVIVIDGWWTAKKWDDWQRDDEKKKAYDRAYSAKRRESMKSAGVVTTQTDVVKSRSATYTDTPTTTEQDAAADAAATRAPARTHEDAPPPAPSPSPGPKASTNSSTDLRPHPMPVKAPKLPPPGDTTIRDRADELVRGSPAADRLRPLAEVAIEVTGYDVGIHTLAQWLGGGYTVERVRAGCAFAVQKYAGQCVPEGTVINTATKWMLRARPDEYPQARAPLAIVPPPPAAPERVRTPEEQAEIMRQFDELSMRLSEPEPATKTASARGR